MVDKFEVNKNYKCSNMELFKRWFSVLFHDGNILHVNGDLLSVTEYGVFLKADPSVCIVHHTDNDMFEVVS